VKVISKTYEGFFTVLQTGLHDNSASKKFMASTTGERNLQKVLGALMVKLVFESSYHRI